MRERTKIIPVYYDLQNIIEYNHSFELAVPKDSIR